MNIFSSILLSIPASIYGLIQNVRAKCYDWELCESKTAPIPVISVGNLLIGGSGKTPFTMYLAGLLRAAGFRPAIVSRGYKGSYDGDYCIVSDGSGAPPSVGPDVCGDEPFMMATRATDVPVLVGRKRIHPATVAQRQLGTNVIILDDGFQHLQLRRDLNIALVTGFEDNMFPLGRLREPLRAIARADVVVLVDIVDTPEQLKKHLRTSRIFKSRTNAVSLINNAGEELPVTTFRDKTVYLFSGIARPERFRRMMEDPGCHIIEHAIFRDHYTLSDDDLRSILDKSGQSPIVTTEKDYVKLPERFKADPRVYALRISVSVENEQEFVEILKSVAGK
jgi:tetraacyldisaccharide 4'-kinase